jgi:hypothetical protein
MKAEMDAGMFFELLDKWEVGSFIGFFEHMLEIAARLVRVNEESEMEILGHGDSFFS